MSQNTLNAGDAGLAWRKSSHSGNGNCVEVATVAPAVAAVAVRDSKDPNGPSLRFAPEAWAAFIADVHEGSFDQR